MPAFNPFKSKVKFVLADTVLRSIVLPSTFVKTISDAFIAEVMPFTVILEFAGFGLTEIGLIMPSITPAEPTMILYPGNETDCVTGVGGNPGKSVTKTVAVTSMVIGYVPAVAVVP